MKLTLREVVGELEGRMIDCPWEPGMLGKCPDCGSFDIIATEKEELYALRCNGCGCMVIGTTWRQVFEKWAELDVDNSKRI